MPDLQADLELVLNVVRQGSVASRAVQGSLPSQAWEKRDRSPVTVADYAVQAIVCRALGDAFPDDPIIAEEDIATIQAPESGMLREQVLTVLAPFGIADIDALLRAIEQGSKTGADAGGCAPTQRCWTLDPIDGTKGFLRGDHYAIALALLVGGQPQLGVLACPRLACGDQPGTLLWAVRGEGAFEAPLDEAEPLRSARRIHVSDQLDPRQLRLCESFEAGHSAHGDSARLQEALGMRVLPVRMDSQAKYGVLARGDAEVYARLPTRADYEEKIWDHAAGVLLIEEAGGRVTDVEGKTLDFSLGRTLKNNRGVLASHGHHHDQLLEMLGRILAAPT